MAKGLLVGLPAATLADMQTKYAECLAAIAVAGQSYSISGRSFNRANLTEVQNMLAEVNYALAIANGTAVTRTVAGFATPYSNTSFTQ